METLPKKNLFYTLNNISWWVTNKIPIKQFFSESMIVVVDSEKETRARARARERETRERERERERERFCKISNR